MANELNNATVAVTCGVGGAFRRCVTPVDESSPRTTSTAAAPVYANPSDASYDEKMDDDLSNAVLINSYLPEVGVRGSGGGEGNGILVNRRVGSFVSAMACKFDDLKPNPPLFRHRSSLLESRDRYAPASSSLRYPLQERLRRLSRSQRKELLIRTGAMINIRPDDKDATDSIGSMNSDQSPEPNDDDQISDSEEDDINMRNTESIVDHPMSSFHTDAGLDDGEEVILATPFRMNDVKLHIYDLIAHDTLMPLPWGCGVCQIGKCFNEMNSALHELGTGAYHVGVEVNGVEYAYGATTAPRRTGVFSSIPRNSPGYQYRTTIDFGRRPLLKKTWVQINSTCGTVSFKRKLEYIDGRQLVKSMATEYMGIDYDIIRRNCCTFSVDVCRRLGIEDHEIPSWFRNLAESGAMTQDFARATVLPITKVLSMNEFDEQLSNTELREDGQEDGFEVVARHQVSGTKELLVVVQTKSPTNDLARSPALTRC